MSVLNMLTADALQSLTALRNRENSNPNLGTILAAEIFYVAIVPFSVVETALTMIGLTYLWAIRACIYFMSPLLQRTDPPPEMITLSKNFLVTFPITIAWANSSAVMNLLPVSLIKTKQEAERFFCCSEDTPEIPEIDGQRVVHLRPVRTNAMSGFLANA